MIGFRMLSRIQTVGAFPISHVLPKLIMMAKGFLPLEDEVLQYYFAKHVTGGLLSKEDIRVLTICLRKMLVLDPNNRAHANVLLQDPWFVRSAYFERDPTMSLSLKSKSPCGTQDCRFAKSKVDRINEIVKRQVACSGAVLRTGLEQACNFSSLNFNCRTMKPRCHLTQENP